MRHFLHRGRPALALVAVLVLTACEHTEAERAQRLLVQRAREHNASVGAAAAVLGFVAAQLVAYALMSDAARRRPPRPRRFPPLLVAAAAGSTVTAALLMGFVGGSVWYHTGPVPVPDVGLDAIGIGLAIIMLLPFWIASGLSAIGLVRLARRVPEVGTPTLVAAGTGHVLAAAAGGVTAWYSTPPEWTAFGWLLASASLLAGVGYAYGAWVRARTARAYRAARPLGPPDTRTDRRHTRTDRRRDG